MPSPVGHSLAGLCGFILARQRVAPRRRLLLFFGSVFIANLPDLDILPGLIWGDPRSFHHLGLHSFMAAAMTGVLIAIVSGRWKLNRISCGAWAAGLYASHVLMDLLVDDPRAPFGAQLLWPFSDKYFISPITPFASFEYFDPTLGVVASLFSLHNLITVLLEIAIMAPLVILVLYLTKALQRRVY